MIYMQINGRYIDAPDPKAHLLEMYRQKEIAYTDYVIFDQLITYAFRKVVDKDHKTIFQMSDTPIRPKARTKKEEEAALI